MAKLFEVLAAEGTVTAAAKTVYDETLAKFHKGDLFKGSTRSLSLLTDSVTKEAQEAAETRISPVVTSVVETLQYALKLWAKAEDVRATKNQTNLKAVAAIVLSDGTVLASGVPVDELMGLESRLTKQLKALISQAPTASAAKTWVKSSKWPMEGLLEAAPTTSNKTKTEPRFIPITPATDKFPATVKEVADTQIVGTYTDQEFTGALTTSQLAAVMTTLDELIVACRQARNRANAVDADQSLLGTIIVDHLMSTIRTN